MKRLRIEFNKEKGLRFLLTLVIASIGGTIFSFLHLPLSWVLGPMLLTTILTMTYREAYLPPSCKLFGFFILGISLGLYFVPEMGNVILDNLQYVVIMSFITILLGFMNGLFYKRFFKLDWITVIFGSIPGGLSQMVEVGRELGGRPEIIAIQQTLRIVLVVVIIPMIMFITSNSSTSPPVDEKTNVDFINISFFILLGLGLLGAFLGKVLKMPIPYFTGPLLLISTVSLTGFQLRELPTSILHLAQIFIGISIGTNFSKSNFSEYRKYILLGLLSAISLTAMSLLLAFLLKIWGDIDLFSAILSTAPGGVAEMSITAVAIGANVPLVAAFQVFRMILAVIIVPKIIVVVSRRMQTKSKTLEG
jgi:uncharacterized protein